MVGAAPTRVVEGGFLAYVTDPIFLIEPFFLILVPVYWILNHKSISQAYRLTLIGLVGGWVLFAITFLLLLPVLQDATASL